MGVMTSTTTGLPSGRSLTYADLEHMPDDGHRYELLDGVLIVSPAPRPLHQRAVLHLAIRLSAACPRELEVLVAPLDVVLAVDTALQPDVLVARRSDLTTKNLPAAPVLAVEVLSPSTRRIDLLLKRSRYEAAGVASYWVVDPDAPSLTVFELRAGRYGTAVEVRGAERYEASRPFVLTLTPAELVED